MKSIRPRHLHHRDAWYTVGAKRFSFAPVDAGDQVQVEQLKGQLVLLLWDGLDAYDYRHADLQPYHQCPGRWLQLCSCFACCVPRLPVYR